MQRHSNSKVKVIYEYLESITIFINKCILYEKKNKSFRYKLFIDFGTPHCAKQQQKSNPKRKQGNKVISTSCKQQQRKKRSKIREKFNIRKNDLSYSVMIWSWFVVFARKICNKPIKRCCLFIKTETATEAKICLLVAVLFFCVYTFFWFRSEFRFVCGARNPPIDSKRAVFASVHSFFKHF